MEDLMQCLSRVLLASPIILGLGLPAPSARAAPTEFPASMTVPGGGASLTRLATGEAHRADGGLAYTDALYAARPAHDLASLEQASPSLLVFQPSGEAGADALRRDFRKVYEDYCTHTVCEHIGRSELQRMIDDIHADQNSSFLVDAKGVTVSLAGSVVTQIADPAFGQHVLTANFGPSSPRSSLRQNFEHASE
jgi:hypothetical protein